jgi:hypothetical protein
MYHSIKKSILIIILSLFTLTGSADVIFFPRQYSVICYSFEFILSLEKCVKPKATNVLWGGAGCIGSFYYFDQPVYGLEFAYERRHYFKPDSYKHFFISPYIGTALMTDFKSTNYIGIVPGIKINYKAQISKNLLLEPYLSLSLPFIYDLPNIEGYVPFPALTIGARIGLGKLLSKANKP